MTRDMRKRIGMSREVLAQLLGVAPITVGRWERGESEPTPYQLALIEAFDAALTPESSTQVRRVLAGQGVVAALHFVLGLWAVGSAQPHSNNRRMGAARADRRPR